jgi:hypothetical protein
MRPRGTALVLVTLVLLGVTGTQRVALAQLGGDQPPAAAVTPDPWPKIVKQAGAPTLHRQLAAFMTATGGTRT